VATESVELLFKFATQGQSQLDAVAASVDRVTGSATNSGNAVDRLTRFMTDGNRAAGASGRSFAELGDKIRSGFQNPVGTAMGALDGLLTKLGGGAVIAGGFGLALAIAGQQAIAFVKSEGEAAEQTINFADRLGIAIGRAEQLQAEMRMAGVNAGALEGAVRGLSLALEDPAGAGEKTIAALRGLGVATNEVSGAQRELGPVLLDVITKLGSITSDSERVAAAQRTLGRGAAIELLPWIKNLDEAEKAIRKIGVGVDEGITQKFAESDKQFDVLFENLTKLRKELTAPMAAPLNSLLGAFNQYLSGSGPDREFKRESLGDFKAPPSPLLGISVLTPEMEIERRYLNGTQRGLQRQLRDLQEALGKEESAIFGNGVGADAKSAAVVKANSLATQIKEIEKQLAEIGKPSAVTKFTAPLTLSAFEHISPGSTLGPNGLIAAMQKALEDQAKQNIEDAAVLKAFEDTADEIQRSVAGGALLDLGAPSTKSFLAERDRNQKIQEADLQAYVKIAELADNEYAAAKRVYDLRTQAAQDDVERHQAELDFQVRVLELEKQRTERYKEQARGVFRALLQGQGGIDALLKSTGTQLLEQVFVNASGSLFKSVGGSLGRAGGASGLNSIPGLGGLLKGTLFDPQNGQSIATDRNTLATEQNTLALTRMASGGVGSIFGGATGNPFIFNHNATMEDMAGIPLPFKYGAGGVKGGINWGKVLGVGGSLAGGAFGIASGVREGGGRGAITATGSAIGATGGAIGAGLFGASAAAGPLAPVLLGIGLSLGFVKSLLGDPKKDFEEAQNKVLSSRAFKDPDAISRQYDVMTGADNFSRNYRGQVVVQRTIQVNINALDAASLETRAEDIAKVMGKAMQAGNPDLQLGINQVVFGPGAA
jgi:hypothetical protein